MLDLVQLGDFARRKPHQLSGGQQQRVAVARALINHPQVLLLDEPLGALDLKLRRQMQLELKRIQTEVGITFVHVTHDQEEAMTMADTVAVMNGGRVEQLGAPADLYENPSTTFVANFLGTSNLIEGEIVVRAATDVVVAAGGGKLAPARRAMSRPRRRSGGSVLVGVRPEKISLTHTDDAAGYPTAATGSPAASPTPASSASPRSTSSTARPARRSRSTSRTSSATAGSHPAPRSSCTGIPEHTFGLDAAQAHRRRCGRLEEEAA